MGSDHDFWSAHPGSRDAQIRQVDINLAQRDMSTQVKMGSDHDFWSAHPGSSDAQIRQVDINLAQRDMRVKTGSDHDF